MTWAGNGCTGGACSASGGPVCFVAGTQIATPEGNVAIEDIREGDAVYALDAEGNVVVSTVADAFTRTATSLVDLILRDAAGTAYTLTGTPEHPFYVPALGDFVPMGDLTPGAELRGLDGAAVTVVAVRARAAAVTVYNFEVAETHTYFVAAESGGAAVGVHNADCGRVQPYDVGTFKDLHNRSQIDDKLQIHHAPQSHPAKQVIPNYDYNNAPAIALPSGEHFAINSANIKGPYSGSPSDLMRKTLQDLMIYTNAPRSALQELLDLARQLYPRSF